MKTRFHSGRINTEFGIYELTEIDTAIEGGGATFIMLRGDNVEKLRPGLMVAENTVRIDDYTIADSYFMGNASEYVLQFERVIGLRKENDETSGRVNLNHFEVD